MSDSGSTFNANPEIQLDMVLAGPIAGPDGHVSTPYNPAISRLQWWITKDCDNPELAFRMGDLMYRHDVSFISRYGEEGVDWTEDPEICGNWVGEYEQLAGYSTKLVMLNNVWNVPQNKMWGFDFLGYRGNDDNMSVGRYEAGKATELNLHDEEVSRVFMEEYVPAYPEEVIFSLNMTAEETEKISDAKTTIDEYVYDAAISFITGNRSLDEWDKYLEELEQMGLQEYTAVMQAAYDRSK